MSFLVLSASLHGWVWRRYGSAELKIIGWAELWGGVIISMCMLCLDCFRALVHHLTSILGSGDTVNIVTDNFLNSMPFTCLHIV